jgi:hypothetical protein
MIKNTIIETRGSVATPFYEYSTIHFQKYRAPLPGTGTFYSVDQLTRTQVNWFSTIDELLEFLEIPEVKAASNTRFKYDIEHFIKFHRSVEYYAPEEYDQYLLEHPETPLT